MSVPFDVAKFSTAGCSGKQLPEVKNVLNKYIVGHDVMTLVWDILTKFMNGNNLKY